MISPQEALRRLKEGNERFYKDMSVHPNRTAELRGELLSEQKPFAAVIACSDSRVPVEIIFDVGLGDIFVVRTAGHVLSKETLGSLEYAVKELNVKLVIILGHDNCGAVKSAMSMYKEKNIDELSDNLKTLLCHIYPIFDNIDTKAPDALDKSIIANIHYQIEDLKERDEYLREKVKKNELKIIGAKYSLNTGIIDFYDEKEGQ